jgi:hypothetical protein
MLWTVSDVCSSSSVVVLFWLLLLLFGLSGLLPSSISDRSLSYLLQSMNKHLV